MLGDVGPYRDRLKREDPSEVATKVAAQFISRVGDEPWASPSIPFDTSEQPVAEIRSANLPVPGEPDVRIRYRHMYESGRVDLLDVTNQDA